MVQTLRHIREAVKAHYQTSTIEKPKHGSLFLAVVDKAIDRLDDERETDLQELIQPTLQELLNEEAEVANEVATLHNTDEAARLQTNDDPKRIESHLLNFAEKAVNKRKEIGEEAYIACLSETTEKIRYSLSFVQEKIVETIDQTTNTPHQTPIEKQKNFIASVEHFSLQIKSLISINSPFKNEIEDFASVIEDAESVLNDFENIEQATERGEIVDTSEDYSFFQLAADYIGDDFRIAWERYIAKDEAIRKSTSAAAKERYSALDTWKEEARELCRTEWRAGSIHTHNKIVKIIMNQERFKTTPGGKYPKDILLREFAKVADEPEFKDRNLKYGMINKK